MYVMNCSRHGVSYAVGRITRCANNPTQEHWCASIRTLRYVRYALDYGLYYLRCALVSEGIQPCYLNLTSKESMSSSEYMWSVHPRRNCSFSEIRVNKHAQQEDIRRNLVDSLEHSEDWETQMASLITRRELDILFQKLCDAFSLYVV